jgi:hypothetical protein
LHITTGREENWKLLIQSGPKALPVDRQRRMLIPSTHLECQHHITDNPGSISPTPSSAITCNCVSPLIWYLSVRGLSRSCQRDRRVA